MSTPYHAKYFAHDLTRHGGQGLAPLARALFDARIALHPHQAEAALFALRPPRRQGTLLADEAGLGKHIAAGLILAQRWAEGQRRLLVICPAAQRRQWALELAAKFHLPTTILADAEATTGRATPAGADAVAIASLHFAAHQAATLAHIPWNLVVVAEAHRLRNAYRVSHRLGHAIRRILEGRHPLLLTATPLQNSLLELYGLAWLADRHLFADSGSFRARYMAAAGTSGDNLDELRDRLRPFCHRTRRRDVAGYTPSTQRHLIIHPFTPTDPEQRLHEAASAYLQRPGAGALPAGQRHLGTMLLHRALASSPQAIAAALEPLRDRLRHRQTPPPETLDPDLFAALAEDAADAAVARPSDWSDRSDRSDRSDWSDWSDLPPAAPATEAAELTHLIQAAREIGAGGGKPQALLAALAAGFAEMQRRGAPRQAAVFTESSHTQDFLKSFLEANGHAGRVLAGTTTGSPAEFNTGPADILIATDAAASALDLQPCALAINYDLPWNPQRLERRIGCCHRYGQPHDVLVINLLNANDEAGQRLHELYHNTFRLFEGAAGDTADALATLDATADFEQRIREIHQQCRGPEEIREAFALLQAELETRIPPRLAETRRRLLEDAGAGRHRRRLQPAAIHRQLDRTAHQLWTIAHLLLAGRAEFAATGHSFDLHAPPAPEIRPGRYHLITKGQGGTATDPAIPAENLLRLGHPLGEHLLAAAKALPTPTASLAFDLASHPGHATPQLAPLKGATGWLTLQRLLSPAGDAPEEHLIFTAITDAGTSIGQESCEQLFLCAATTTEGTAITATVQERLATAAHRHLAATLARSRAAAHHHSREASAQLENWAADQLRSARRDLERTQATLHDLERQASQATTTQERLALQQEIADLEKLKHRQCQCRAAAAEQITARRDALIAALQGRHPPRPTVEPLFTIRWQAG
jgi:hypothetical protein